MAISKAVDRLIDSASETYFQLLDEPLPGYKRFLYAGLGSLSLFSSSILILDRKIQDVGEFLGLVLFHTAVSPILIAILVFSGIYIIPSVFFGFLVSMAKTRHGRVRLYLSGILLPAFVVSVMRATWTIDAAREAGGGN